MGNVGYILRNQGLTQLTPTGIGIQPFDTTTLWGNIVGVGCTYPHTFAQYGYVAIWANDNGIYMFTSGAAPQEIAGVSKEAIYNDINQFENDSTYRVLISGAIINGSDNNKRPELLYNLVIIQNISTVMTMIVWSYSINKNVWSRTVVDLFAKLEQIVGGTITSPLIQYATSQGIFIPKQTDGYLTETGVAVRKFYGTVLISLNMYISGNYSSVSILLFQYINDTGQSTNQPTLLAPVDLQFKQEEIKLARQPNIRMVVVKAAGFGQLGVQVSNEAFSTISVASPTPASYLSSGVYTGENPQLNITSPNFDGYIVKAMMPGTYADGDL
jgi:hypothetical protein